MATTLIDGHNLIASLPDVSLSDPDDEQQLLAKLERSFSDVPGRVVVVFDPGHNPPVDAPPYQGRHVEALFARSPDRADDVIMELIRRDPNPKHLTVVTADREIIACANRRRCRVVKPGQFQQILRRRRERPVRRNSGDKPLPAGELASAGYLQYWYDYFDVPAEERERTS